MATVEQPYTDFDVEEYFGDVPIGQVGTHNLPDFGRMTSQELFAADFTVDYLIDGILVAGQHGVISGRFKSQKTHIAVAAAISIATGAKFLGKYDIPASLRVGVFCGEGGPAPLQAMTRLICQCQQVDTTSLGRLFWYTRVPRVGNSDHREALAAAIAADSLDVVFLDPTYLLLSGVSDQASNYMVMADKLSLLTEIGEQTGVTFIVVHHNKKGNEHSVPQLGDLAFGGTAEWAGQWILLGHRKSFDPVKKRSQLWMNVGGRLGQGGLYGLDITESENGRRCWHAMVRTENDLQKRASEAKEQKGQEGIDEKISSINKAFDNSDTAELSSRKLADTIETRYDSKVFLNAIEQMKESGELEQVTVKAGNNKETVGYRRVSGTENRSPEHVNG